MKLLPVTPIATSAALYLLIATSVFPQGSLTPPGPPGPTMKTLEQVEPRTPISSAAVITAPGSYYLTASITNGGSGPVGIVIAASDVTLDLNGFTVKGSAGAGPGIINSGARTNIVIKNGIVSNWISPGIQLGGDVTGVRIEGLIVEDGNADGIYIGKDAVVVNCVFRFNAGSGLHIAGAGVVKDCLTYDNFEAGIKTGAGSLVANSVAHDNGDEGISVGDGSTVQACSATNHFFSGFLAGNDATFVDCTAKKNNNGFEVGNGATIQRCVAATNDFDGIRAGSNNFIVGNLCEGNGALSGITNGAGIHTLSGGRGNRIDGNNLVSNDIGVQCESDGNLIIRNSSRGGSVAYSIAAGNSEGQEINVYNPNATTVITNSNPWANFLY